MNCWKKVHKEIQSGRIIGPFKNLPLSNLHLSPVGLVPKSDGGVENDHTLVLSRVMWCKPVH